MNVVLEQLKKGCWVTVDKEAIMEITGNGVSVKSRKKVDRKKGNYRIIIISQIELC